MHSTESPVTQNERIRKGVFKNLSLKLFIIGCLFFGALFIFAIIIDEAVYGKAAAFDNRVFAFFAAITNDKTIRVMNVFTFFGSADFLLPAYTILICCFLFLRKFRYALHIFVVVASSTALMFALKEITRRHRPESAIIQGITNYSFPSGHSLSIFIFCGIFTYIIWHAAIHTPYKWLYSVLLFCFTITVGISRIVLKVHYPTDVLASFCIGTVWAISSLWILKRISRKPTAPVKSVE